MHNFSEGTDFCVTPAKWFRFPLCLTRPHATDPPWSNQSQFGLMGKYDNNLDPRGLWREYAVMWEQLVPCPAQQGAGVRLPNSSSGCDSSRSCPKHALTVGSHPHRVVGGPASFSHPLQLWNDSPFGCLQSCVATSARLKKKVKGPLCIIKEVIIFRMTCSVYDPQKGCFLIWREASIYNIHRRRHDHRWSNNQ